MLLFFNILICHDKNCQSSGWTRTTEVKFANSIPPPLVFTPAYPLKRVAGASTLERLEIPQQFYLNLEKRLKGSGGNDCIMNTRNRNTLLDGVVTFLPHGSFFWRFKTLVERNYIKLTVTMRVFKPTISQLFVSATSSY